MCVELLAVLIIMVHCILDDRRDEASSGEADPG